MNKMSEIWLRDDQVKLSYKIQLYRSLVKSVLLYNCGTWGLTKSEANKIDAFHRKQLRRLLGIRYPTKITNTNLYKKCQETPLSITILSARWRLFGHILRRDPQIPANKAMRYYFQNSKSPNFRGHARTTLPITLTADLERMHKHTVYGEHSYTKRTKLSTMEDLHEMREIAQDRKEWRVLTKNILRAAQAESSVDDSAKEL